MVVPKNIAKENHIMGKKKNNLASSLADILNIGEQLLRTGEIRMNRKVVIDMNDITKPSIEGTIGSRIDCLEDHSDVSLEKEPIMQVNAVNDTLMHHYHLMSQIGYDPDHLPTIVVTLPHKKALESFTTSGSGILPDLMRNSNLPLVMRAIVKNWKNLLEENEGMDCILHIPALIYFGGSGKGLLNMNTKFNLLVYVTRKKRYIYDEDDYNQKPEKLTKDLVKNILDTIIKIGAKNILIDPLAHPILKDDIYTAVDAWKEEERNSIRLQNIERLQYCIPDGDDYVIFWRARK